jgi:hypothetical protein
MVYTALTKGMVRNIYLYLDRTFLVSSKSLKPVWEMGLELFRKFILDDPLVYQSTLKCFWDKMVALRDADSLIPTINSANPIDTDTMDSASHIDTANTNPQDTNVLKTCCGVFSGLDIYYTKFEPAFLQTTREYYQAKALEFTKEIKSAENSLNSSTQYLDYIIESLELSLIHI